MSALYETEKILLNMLQNSQFCPSQTYKNVNIKLLIQLAGANKAEHVLLHFLTCESCLDLFDKPIIQKLEQLRFRLHALPLVFEGERRQFEQILKKRRIKAVLFKQFGNRDRVGADMDVLVSKQDLSILTEEAIQQGYIKTAKVRHKEIQLTNPVNRFKIDVHHMVAFPHYGGLKAQELQQIEQYSSDIFKAAGNQRSGFVRVPIEWYVVSRILHYWYNDILCSIYPLYEISSFCYVHRHTIHWNELFSIADTYSFRNEILFVLSLANKILGIGLPTDVSRRISFRIALASSAITLDDIVYFPHVSLWYHKRYSVIAQKKYRRYFFVKLLVNQGVPFTRLLRIRILMFILDTLTNK